VDRIDSWRRLRSTQREQRVVVEISVASALLNLEEFSDGVEYLSTSARLELVDLDKFSPHVRPAIRPEHFGTLLMQRAVDRVAVAHHDAAVVAEHVRCFFHRATGFHSVTDHAIARDRPDLPALGLAGVL
jgi:hypothetical protein